MSKITTLPQLVALAAETAGRWGTLAWWRGHASEGWPLVPSAFRDGRNHSAERNMAVRFMAKARTRRTGCPDKDDLAAWLTLMQHYRLPTRLLDWTESPLAALFFVVRDQPSSDGRLWLLNPYRLNNTTVGKSLLFGADSVEAGPLLRGAFESQATPKNRALALTPWETDLRMLLQASAFTVHDSGTPLETFDGSEEFLASVTISADAKKGLLQHLNVLNVRPSTLFPDLETLATDIAGYEFADDTPDDGAV